MTAVPVPRQPQPSEAELKARAVIRSFAAEFGWTERGRPLGDVRMNQLAKRIAAAVEPKGRPQDPAPMAPRGVTARSAARKAAEEEVAAAAPAPVAPAPPPVPPAPPKLLEDRLTDVDRRVLALVGEGLPNAVIAVRVGLSVDQAKAKVRRLRTLLDAGSRAGIPRAAERAGILGVVAPGVESMAVCPPAASGAADGSPGLADADRASQGPSGALAS